MVASVDCCTHPAGHRGCRHDGHRNNRRIVSSDGDPALDFDSGPGHGVDGGHGYWNSFDTFLLKNFGHDRTTMDCLETG